jgi:hypothetical protein
MEHNSSTLFFFSALCVSVLLLWRMVCGERQRVMQLLQGIPGSGHGSGREIGNDNPPHAIPAASLLPHSLSLTHHDAMHQTTVPGQQAAQPGLGPVLILKGRGLNKIQTRIFGTLFSAHHSLRHSLINSLITHHSLIIHSSFTHHSLIIHSSLTHW